ncbi:class I SAM-dependent methyltransferase [bacterium]|nr:class I SAM-dependent methyltransferase [bacterium]
MCGTRLGVRSAAAGEAFSASGILKATGVQGGLVVHLGCGNGNTTASLLNGDGFLVQGLDADGENVAAARRHIRSLGQSLWDNWCFALLVIGLAGFEWIVRRRHDLL